LARIALTRVSARARGFAASRWPLFVAAISLTGAATTLCLGIGLNLSRSAPRGVYRSVADTQARGALVVVVVAAGELWLLGCQGTRVTSDRCRPPPCAAWRDRC